MAQINAEDVARALGQASRLAGGGWKCRCPAHEDRDPSLSLHDQPGGGLLWRCHAGCSQETVQEALRARGFLGNGDARSHRSPFYIAALGGEPSAVYEYRDRDGRILFQVARYEPATGDKEIRPWRRNGAKLEAKASSPPRVLYRLPQLLDHPEHPVLVVEGEKCADAAARLLADRYAVTTWAGGANAVSSADWAPLAGRDAILWPDADDAGIAAMAALAVALASLGGRVRVLKIEDRPAGWDIADAIAEEWTVDDLRTFIDDHAHSAQAGPTAPDPPAGNAVYRCMADVAVRPVRWLWPGRIPRAKLALIAGHPGLGKSQVVVSLAAIVSSGGRWPITEERAPKGTVILLNAEDAADDTIRPRLEAASADISRVYELQAVRDGYAASGQPLVRGFRLDRDLPALQALARRLGQVDLIAIDPATAYLGEVDAYSNAEVRAMLAPLADLAEETGAAVVLISHLNKSLGVGEALLRISASIAFTAAARVAYLVARDTENPKRRRLFLPVKNNLAEDETGLAFEIESTTTPVPTSRVMWESEPVSISADEAVRGPASADERSDFEDAKRFLRGVLADGPVKSRQIRADAQDAGHAWRTIERAQRALGVDAYKDGMRGGWWWRLPTG